MIQTYLKRMPELAISGAMTLTMLLFSLIFNLPIIYPSGERAAFVGIHYIYPLIGVGLLGILTFFVGNRAIASRFLIALPCYAAILFAHFNIKLWIPHINPTNFDASYWALDQLMRPVVDACMFLRRSAFFFIPYDSNFYMISYISLFYTSFLYHAIKTPEYFGRLILSASLLQVFGPLAFIVPPAVWSFLYQAGFNPTKFDASDLALAQLMKPVVAACMCLRRSAFFFIPYESNFYMISYIALFYTSFLYHAIKTPEYFGRLIISALLLQVFGTLAYLVAPAVGPFIYEAGVNPMITGGQHSMLEFYRNSVATGPAFLAKHGSINFTVGLAAMPSFHSASAYLFFLFAWKHGKVLVPLYSFILAYILIMAVASRWHYIIDIPVGMTLAWASYKLADWFTPLPNTKPAIAMPTAQEPLLT